MLKDFYQLSRENTDVTFLEGSSDTSNLIEQRFDLFYLNGQNVTKRSRIYDATMMDLGPDPKVLVLNRSRESS